GGDGAMQAGSGASGTQQRSDLRRPERDAARLLREAGSVGQLHLHRRGVPRDGNGNSRNSAQEPVAATAVEVLADGAGRPTLVREDADRKRAGAEDSGTDQ